MKSVLNKINTILETNSVNLLKMIYAVLILTLSFQTIYSFVPALISVYFISIDRNKKHGKIIDLCFVLLYLSSIRICLNKIWPLQLLGYFFCILFIKNKKFKKDNYSDVILKWICSFLILVIMETMQFSPIKPIQMLFTLDIQLKILMLISFYVIMTLIEILTFVFNRKIALYITLISCSLLSIINFFVLSFTKQKFVYSDITSANTAFKVIGTYHLTFKQAAFFIASIVAIVFCFLIIKYFVHRNRITFLEKLKTVISYALFLMFFIMIFINNENFNIVDFVSEDKCGYILEFVNSCKKDLREPDNYEYYSNIETKNDKTENENEIKPNIIIVMSEAFSDLSVVNELKTNKEVIPYTKEIMEESVSGYVYSSVWGNNTVSSEFECLTGIPTAFTTRGARVYKLYMNENIPSLAKTLKENGYNTYGIHPFDGDGYNRREAWNMLGLDKELFEEDFNNTTKIRGYISDKDNFDKVIEVEKNDENPVFIMNVTMQNHGGYEEVPNLEDEIIAKNFDDKCLNNYLTLIHESDKSIKNFIDYYRNYEEPTIILFFGDHQPGLDEFYENLEGNEELWKNRYKIPFFIWSNYEIDEIDMPNETSINYFPGILLKEIGISDTWFNFVYDTMDEYPIISKYVYKNNGYMNENDWKNYIKTIVPGKEAKAEKDIKIYESKAFQYIKP